MSSFLLYMLTFFHIGKINKEVAKGNLRRDMYLHRFSKVPVHAVQTYLIIRWAVTESSA